MSPLTKGANTVREWVLPYLMPLLLGGGAAVGGANIAVARMAADIAGIQSGLLEIKASVKELQGDLRKSEVEDARRDERVTVLQENVRSTSEQQLRVFERLRVLEIQNGKR